MYIPEFNKNRMQINVMWAPDISVLNTPRYSRWLSGAQKRYRSIEYTDQKGDKHRGFIQSNHPSNESFAVYVKEMYGDGFYFSPVTGEETSSGVYLLIIQDDVILSGTDAVFSTVLFQRIDEARGNTGFSDLSRVELGTRHFDEITEKYKKNILAMRRKKIYGYAVFAAMLAVFSVFLYFVTTIVISG